MMRIEFDRVLEYLATGEDEELIVAVFPMQPDARAVLASARTALKLLSGEQLGVGVRRRTGRVGPTLALTLHHF